MKDKNPKMAAVTGLMIAALLVQFPLWPLPAAADRLNQAARGGDIDKAVIAMRLVTQLKQVPCLPQ